jgi:hypothetical protein
MKLGKYPVKRSDTRVVKKLKRKLNHVERSIASCLLRGFDAKKLVDARCQYIDQIKKAI